MVNLCAPSLLKCVKINVSIRSHNLAGMDFKSLSKKLNMSEHQLRQEMREAGIRVGYNVKKINNAIAREVIKKLSAEPAAPQKVDLEKGPDKISIGKYVSVKEFSEKLERPVAEVIKKLIENGVMATINEEIDADTAIIIGEEFGTEVAVEAGGSDSSKLGFGYVAEVLAKQDPKDLKARPPIVAVMGHVDHGKTTLLDAVRKTNVVQDEAGAITQHIGAYQVEVHPSGEPKSRAGEASQGTSGKITFLDTPGHEAFAAMRARGANVTDIIVLVVAADDSVKPQTVEVINRAKLAKIPIVLAINKIDKPDANPDRVKADLAQLGVQVEEWGGKVPVAMVSAKTGKGIDELLELILLTAEMEELTANPSGEAVGAVIESHLSRGQGAVATVLVQNGTLEVGDPVVVGVASGKIRSLEDSGQNKVKKASPATPVKISGLSDVPEVGDIFRVVGSIDEAKRMAFSLKRQERVRKLRAVRAIKADRDKQELNLIIRADVQGSLEAILEALNKLESEDVKLKIVESGVGEVSESDVNLARSTDSTVISFQARINQTASKIAKQKGVTIDQYDVIYELVEDVTNALLEMMPVEVVEKDLGRAKIKAVFMTDLPMMIIGGDVAEGKIVDKKKFYIMRDKEKIGAGKIEELQTGKQDVDEVSSGKEFGLKVKVDALIKEGDLLEIFDEEVKKKELKS